MDKQKIKQIKKVISWVLILALVAVLAAMPLLARTEEETDGPVASILSGTVGRGDVVTQIIGGGILAGENAKSVEIPVEVKITEYLVANGDTVAEGDPVAKVDRVSLMTAITQVQDVMDDLEKEIRKISGEVASEKVIAQGGGTVKVIYAREGESVEDVMLRDGALAVLSLDGMMAVRIARETELVGGDTVCVILSDDTEIEGRVESNLEGVLTVTVDDEGYEVGERVTVTTEDGNRIGSGQLYIHAQWNATAYSGTVSKIRVSVDDTLKAGKAIMDLKDTGHTAKYDALSHLHREYEELMLELFRMYQSETVTAPGAGVITGVDENGTYMLAAGAEKWEVSLLANAPNGDDETSYVNYVGQVWQAGVDGLILRINPQTVSVTDYKDLSGVSQDPALMTQEVVLNVQPPVYELSGGEWAQISFGSLTAGDILLFAGDTGGIIWAVRIGRGTVTPEEPTPTDPSAPSEPTQPTDPNAPTEPGAEGGNTKPNTPSVPGQSGGRFPQGGSFGGMGGGMGGAMTEEEEERYSLDKVSICSVLPQEEMTVEITVDELDITKLYVGQRAQLTVNPLVGQTFEAEVTRIGNLGTSEGGNSKFTVELTVARAADMLPGMNASAFITLETLSDVVCVPVEALVEEGNEVFLYTGYDEELKTFTNPVKVELGLSDGTNVQILSGIAEGRTYYYPYYDTLEISNIPQMPGFSFGR